MSHPSSFLSITAGYFTLEFPSLYETEDRFHSTKTGEDVYFNKYKKEKDDRQHLFPFFVQQTQLITTEKCHTYFSIYGYSISVMRNAAQY
jgi:hypothetical protein